MSDTTTNLRDVRAAQGAHNDWAKASSWGDAASLWDHLRRDTNIVRAAEQVDWDSLLAAHATVLDLGCGAGWLAAMLSTRPGVDRVLAWDSSSTLLTDVLGDTVRLVGGDARKIEAVCGDFVPLVIEDRTVDVVAMSSAFHHADRPGRLLAEISRVLRDGGALVLLNETPWHPLAMLSFATRTYAAALSGLAGRPRRWHGHLGADHVLYDEKLGDRAYTLRTWRKMARDEGWSIEVIDTGLTSYTENYRARGRLEPNLFHFILRPQPDRGSGASK
jgi:SAM-dependent methyltransferase